MRRQRLALRVDVQDLTPPIDKQRVFRDVPGTPNLDSWGLAPFINLENSDSANSQSNSMSCPGLSPDPGCSADLQDSIPHPEK